MDRTEDLEEIASGVLETADFLAGQTEWNPETGACGPGLSPEEVQQLRGELVPAAAVEQIGQTGEDFSLFGMAVCAVAVSVLGLTGWISARVVPREL